MFQTEKLSTAYRLAGLYCDLEAEDSSAVLNLRHEKAMNSHQMPQSRSTSSFFKSLPRFLENEEDRHVRSLVGTLVCTAIPDLAHWSSTPLSSATSTSTEPGDSAPRLRSTESYSGCSSMLSRDNVDENDRNRESRGGDGGGG
jgi:hypothetical protein